MSETPEKTTKKFRLGRMLFILLLIVMLLLFGLIALSTLSAPFQTRIIKTFLSKQNAKMEEAISIDKVSFHPVKGAVIKDLLILDDNQDTLLYSQEFYSGLTDNILTVFNGQLSLSDVTCNNAQLNIKTLKGESQSNLSRFFNQFTKENSQDSIYEDTTGRQVNLALDALNANNIYLTQLNELTGKSVEGGIDGFYLKVDEMDLADRVLILEKIEIDKPSLAIHSKAISQSESTLVSPVDDVKSEKQDDPKQTMQWSFGLHKFRMSNGQFANTNDKNIQYSNPHPHIKLRNLNVSEVSLKLDSVTTNLSNALSLQDFALEGKVTNDRKSYFMNMDALEIDAEEGSVQGLDVKTGDSRLRTNVELIYDDFVNFANFQDKVFCDLDIRNSTVSFLDIAYFLPNLNTAPWIEKNINKTVNISGEIKGRVNNFSSKELTIDVANEVAFNGSVRIKDVTDPDNTFLSIRTDELSTSIDQLTRLIPGFSPPQDYYKLGNIVYSGTFTGFTYDFVANGSLKSSLGQAILDTRFDLKPGPANARYSGRIDLIDFDLKTWTGNDDFGIVTASSTVKNGRGLLIDYLKADLNASLTQFDYRDYRYTNIKLTGNFNENQFNGDFGIEDENIDFNFDGLVNVKDGKITTKLSAYADKVDLQKLNLSDEEFIIQGDFDLNLSGQSIKDITGDARIGSVNIFYKGNVYHFDTISVVNTMLPNNERNLELVSDYVNLTVEGEFNPTNLPYHFTSTLSENHPQWWEKLRLKKAKRRDNDLGEDFDFDLVISDSNEFADLLDIGCYNVKNLIATGHIETDNARWFIDTSMDELSCDSLVLSDIEYSLTYLDGRGKTNLKVDEWIRGDKMFPQLLMTGNLDGDDIKLNLSTEALFDSIGIVDISLEGHPVGDEIYINMVTNQLQIMSGDWQVTDNNQIIIGDNLIEVNDFKITDGERTIAVDDLNQKGLKVNLEEFNLDFINGLIDYQNIYFSGAGDVSVLVDDIFDRGRFWTEVKVPELLLNEEDYGEINFTTGTRDFSTFEGLIKIVRKEDNQRIEANFDFEQESKVFNAFIQGTDVDLSLFEFIIAEGTSGTSGKLDITATIAGVIDDFELEGQALLRDGQTKIDYLGAEIFFDQQELRLTNTMVDLTGVEITDIEGNVATVQGGLRHDLLRDFSADATLSANKIIALNTTKDINPVYYGKVIGDMDIIFKGPFTSIDIEVNGTSLPGTVLNIPVESSEDGFEESFITFVDKRDLIQSIIDTTLVPSQVEISGMNINLNLDVTPDANLKLIFNERLNDIISATGRGNLQVISTRTGEFNIYGNYEIESGDYLFTAWGFLAKPFRVERGSFITWTGDPFNATLNINAILDNVRAPLYTFIQEYLPVSTGTQPNDLVQTANKRTDIDLKLKLEGQLYSPEVSFDLDFPDVEPNLRSYVDSKMRTLRQNEAELNDQVAALLIFQSFIPSNNALGSSFFNANNLAYSGINTLSEFISSQISFQLSNLLQQAIVDNKYLSSIDFELAFANNTAFDNGQFETDLLPDEIGVNVTSTLKNDRWGVGIGGNYVRDNGFSFGDYTTQDFRIEYYITDDKRLKLRVYGQNDFDLVVGNFEREQRYGVGISYRKEFGTFSNLKEDIDKSIKRAARRNGRNQE